MMIIVSNLFKVDNLHNYINKLIEVNILLEWYRNLYTSKKKVNEIAKFILKIVSQVRSKIPKRVKS